MDERAHRSIVPIVVGVVQYPLLEPLAMDPHLRDLRYFVAVAEHLSFTRAAQDLFLSQPALSKQIRVLEGRLRAPLFERGAGAVRLTRAGAALAPRARALLAGWEAAERSVAMASDCTLTLGMHTSPGRGLLPEVRRRMAADCGDARLVMRQVGWGDPTAGLADRRSDASFVFLPLPGGDRYAWVTVAREPRLVALAAGHRLAARDQVSMADLLDEPFLALPASAGPMRDYWLALDARDGRPARVTAEISDPEETYEAVSTGIGVCLLAAGNAPILDRGQVVMVPVAGIRPAELVLAWSPAHRPPLLDAFVGHVRAIVDAVPLPA